MNTQILNTQSEMKARIFNVKTFYRHLKNLITHFSELRESRKRGHVNNVFSEKIMLAVSIVNGCRYCNYLHTKNIVAAGYSEDDIKVMLGSDVGAVGNDEAVALIFAEHYADTNGYPDKKTYQDFFTHYDEEKATDILAVIRAIMVGNIHGISLDAIQSRIKGSPMPGSNLINEIGISIGILFLIPIAIVQVLFGKLGAK